MKKMYNLILGMMFSIVISLPAFADVTVDGFCYLDGETNHSGTKVLFTADSPTASTDSVFTIADGSFSIGLSTGIYQVTYSHDGWVMDSIAGGVPLFAGTTLDTVTLALANFREVSGPQSGIWTPDSIYHVIGNISIDNGDSLVIEPGTIVTFMDFYSFEVYGLLTAIGTDTDSIYFTTGQDEPDGTEEWTGITFKNSSNDNSIISYSNIEYAYNGVKCDQYDSSPSISNNTINNNFIGIKCNYSNPFISNNVITDNYLGIFCQTSSPTIDNNTISDNSDGGIRCQNTSSPIISYNTINNNGDEGIMSDYGCMPAITYNTINNNNIGIDCGESITISNNIINSSNNYGIIIRGYSSDAPVVINNTISNGNRGIYSNNSSPFILNNIIIGNETGLEINHAPSSLEYNLLWDNGVLATGGGLPAFFGELLAVNVNGDSCDAYLNIFMDPLMVDSDYSVFDLMPNSPCVDAGNPDPAYNDPDGTIADMGALYHDQNMPFANFEANVTEGYFPLTVDFTDISLPVSASIVEWFWDFGDGNTSTLQNPTHTFVNGQNDHVKSYTISLVIADSDGLTDSLLKINYIEARKSIIDVPADYATIQEGIDAALNSDTVLVAPGTYVENINFNGKSITVASMFINTQDTSYISQTIIDGNQVGHVVRLENGEDSTTVLTGFTLTNGDAYGGGLWIQNSNPVILYCTISGNLSYSSGGGIAIAGFSSPTISNCSITGNLANDSGGGIYGESTNLTNPPIIENCLIENNSAFYGGGCYFSDNSIVRKCQIVGNATTGGGAMGGGFYCYSSSPLIENCVINGNSSDYLAGAIFVRYTEALSVINTIVEGNYGSEGIYFDYNSFASITYCDFYNNEGADFGGYVPDTLGIVADINFNNDSCDLFHNIFLDPAFATTKSSSDYYLSENSPCRNAGDPDPMYNDPDGTYADIGAFYFEQTTPFANFEADTVEGYFPLAVDFTDLSIPVISTIVDWQWDFGDGNTSSVQNPSHIYQNKGLYDVTLVVTDSDSNTDTLTKIGFINAHASVINVPSDYLTIQEGIDASFNGDTVLVDPGVYVENIDFKGKNITVASLYITLQDTSYISQTIIDGGGNGTVATINSNEDSTSMISGFTIRNGINTYQNGGGIIVLGASPQINNLNISDNSAGSGSGGGIYLQDSKSVISNCNILNNSAGGGGGLYIHSSSFVKLVNNNISNNYASSNGGGIYIYGCSPSLINNLISDNWSDNATSGAGGIRCYNNASPLLINNTIVNNSGANGGGLRIMNNSNPVLINNIFWGNTATESGNQIRLDDDTSDPDFMYCDIESGIAGFGFASGATFTGAYDNCVEADPLFADYLNGDYELEGFSPCINTGTPDTTGLGLPQLDLAGNTRIMGNIVDIGCYEYALTGDMYVFELKAFFEGPFTGTEMITFLNLFGQIPLTHPYDGPSWDYEGIESVSSIPNSNVVDWVLVELRDAPDAASATSGTILSRQVGFILKDGSIVRIDGVSNLQFSLTVTQQLFAVIYHRNHVPVISANPLTESSGIHTYDFTDGVGKALGGDKAQTEIATGIWGMMAGDANGDGQVSNADKNDFWSVQEGTAGYLESDFGMDGPVNSLDKDKWILNSGKGTQVPE